MYACMHTHTHTDMRELKTITYARMHMDTHIAFITFHGRCEVQQRMLAAVMVGGLGFHVRQGFWSCTLHSRCQLTVQQQVIVPIGLFLKHETVYSSFNSRKVGLDSLSVIIPVSRYSYIYANMTHNSSTTTIHSMSLYHIIHNSWCSQLTEVRDGQ